MELLLCERRAAPLERGEVETVVKTAITYGGSGGGRRKPEKQWVFLYGFALMIGVLCGLRQHLSGGISELLLVAVLLGGIFGAYFCFFARPRLPGYYDENRINGIIDGPVRMNIPGLRFSNRNWPYLVSVGRIWSCAAMSVLPLLTMAFCSLLPELWAKIGEGVFLALLLGGLFVPMLVVGKAYE